MTGTSWRDRLAVHPACENVPPISAHDFESLAADIAKNGLVHPIVLWRQSDDADYVLLDGRSRLDALSSMPDAERRISEALRLPIRKGASTDPWKYVCSVNLHRRHLSAEEKRDFITNLLKADASRSNRSIAGLAKVSDHTVASVRNDLIDGAQIAHHAERVGKDGVTQPATKPPAHRQPPAAVVHNTVPRAAPISQMDQARQQREARFVQAPRVERSLAHEIEAFRVSLKEQRPQVELIDRPTRLKLARGLVQALGIDPAEFVPGGAP
jgi:hypothetical protein